MGKFLKRALWLEPFWILLLGAPLLLPGTLLDLTWHPYLVAGLFLFWPLDWIASRRLMSNTPLAWGVFGILLWLPVPMWAAVDWKLAWSAAGYLLFGLALCVALLRWSPTQKRPILVAAGLIAAASGLALISPVLVEWKPLFRLFRLPLYSYLRDFPLRAPETIHANVLTGVLVLALPLTTGLATSLAIGHDWTRQRLLPLLCGLLTLFIAGVIVLTQSRGGYLAAAAAMGLLLLLRWPRLLSLVPVGLLLGGLLVWHTGYTAVLNELSTDGALGGWSGRLDVWTQALIALSDFRYTGIGLGNFTEVIPLLYPLLYNIDNYPHAHNLYLQIGVDMGLPGLFFYLVLLSTLIVMLYRLLQDRTDPLRWTLAAGAAGGLLAFLVHGLLDAVTWGTKIAFVPWVLFALIGLLDRQRVEMGTGRDICSDPQLTME